MISFKNFLTESRSASLWHATGNNNLESILLKGFRGDTYQTIYKGKGQNSWGRYGVSFARNKAASDMYYIREIGGFNYVVLEVDQQKIASRFRIEPVDYFGTQQILGANIPNSRRRTETEEFVTVSYKNGESQYISPKIIKAVHYFKKYKGEIAYVMEKYPEIKWIERN